MGYIHNSDEDGTSGARNPFQNKGDLDRADETWLIDGLRQGSDRAYRRFIRQHQARIFGIAYGITLDREESLDIVQEVFFKVFQTIDTFRGESSLSTWLHRIAINQCMNWKRKWRRRFRWRRPVEEEDDGDALAQIAADGEHPEALVQAKEREKILFDALNRLPEGTRAVFVLKEWDGLSYEEISRALKINKGTVSSRLFNARRQLQKALQKDMSENEG